MFSKFDKGLGVLARIEAILERVEKHLPADTAPDWNKFIAFRWKRSASLFGHRGHLAGVAHPHVITFADLKDIDEQKARLEANTILIEKDRLIIGSDPLGIYEFERPDKKTQE